MKKLLVVFLIICTGIMPALPGYAYAIPGQDGSDGQKQSITEQKPQTAFREKVELMGPSAQVRITLQGSSAPVKYEGSIDEITAEGFKLKMKNQILRIQESGSGIVPDSYSSRLCNAGSGFSRASRQFESIIRRHCE